MPAAGRVWRCLLSAAALATLLATQPASAQGLLQFLFGGWSAKPAAAPVESLPSVPRFTITPRGRGAATSYCVRLCDGRYFPIQRTANATPVALCNAFCPASTTKVFSGAPIEQAVAADGSRYDDLDNAYVYRKQALADCTCNGRDQLGNARIDAASDPTLQPGDLIATKDGLVAYSPRKREDDSTADVTGSIELGLRGALTDGEIKPEPKPTFRPARRRGGAVYYLVP